MDRHAMGLHKKVQGENIDRYLEMWVDGLSNYKGR